MFRLDHIPLRRKSEVLLEAIAVKVYAKKITKLNTKYTIQ
jgi:hypothetical protein